MAHLGIRQLWLQRGDVLVAQDGLRQAALQLEHASQIAERDRQPLRLRRRVAAGIHLELDAG